MGLGAIGSAIGEGQTASRAALVVSERPEQAGTVVRTMLVGQAVAETTGIFSLVVAIMLMFRAFPGGDLNPVVEGMAVFAAGLSIGVGAIGGGVGAGFVSAAAVDGIVRQPASSGLLTTTMLIGQAISQTTAIYALVVSFILIYKGFGAVSTFPYVFVVLSAGLCMGFGAVGPGMGEGWGAGKAIQGIARNPRAAEKVTTTMLVGLAMTETSSIFAMIVSFVVLFKSFGPEAQSLPMMAAILGSGLVVGIGAIGSGIGCGIVMAEACVGIAKNPESSTPATRTMLIAQAVSQSTSVYALLVALVLLFLL